MILFSPVSPLPERDGSPFQGLLEESLSCDKTNLSLLPQGNDIQILTAWNPPHQPGGDTTPQTMGGRKGKPSVSPWCG